MVYDNGAKPLGSWTAESVWVSNAWYFLGTAPNEQDVGMLVVSDQPIGGGTHRIGEVTGLSWQLDKLARRQRSDDAWIPSESRRWPAYGIQSLTGIADGGNNTVKYGTAMSHGASGGPWVQDFGVAPNWTPGTSDPSVPMGTNMVVGVTSYGPCNMGVLCPQK
jgi:hypothetical protein